MAIERSRLVCDAADELERAGSSCSVVCAALPELRHRHPSMVGAGSAVFCWEGQQTYGQHADRVDRELVGVGVAHGCGVFWADSGVQKGVCLCLRQSLGRERMRREEGGGRVEEGGVLVLCECQPGTSSSVSNSSPPAHVQQQGSRRWQGSQKSSVGGGLPQGQSHAPPCAIRIHPPSIIHPSLLGSGRWGNTRAAVCPGAGC